MAKKRVVAKEITWRDKYITLTDTRLYIRNQSGGEIRDTLELRQITHVRTMVESNHAIAIKGSDMQDSFRSAGSYGKKMRSLSEQIWSATGMITAPSAPYIHKDQFTWFNLLLSRCRLPTDMILPVKIPPLLQEPQATHNIPRPP